jgi:predicted MFS family arabinose efflux permease
MRNGADVSASARSAPVEASARRPVGNTAASPRDLAADAPAAATGRRLPRRVSFYIAAVTFTAVGAAAGAPSPLFVIYQQQWHFPAWTLTIAFAIYAFTLLVALLVAGSLSDHVGRRPVIIGALIVQLAAMITFILAPDIWVVVAARALQGLATGAATSTFSAMISEIAPARQHRTAARVVGSAPVGGLALGALLSGLAVQYSPSPTVVEFAGFAAVFLTGAVAAIFTQETVTARPGAAASLIPRVTVPHRARGPFAAAVPSFIGTWMSMGLMLGLGGSLNRQLFGIVNGGPSGAIIAVMPAAATLSGIASGRYPLRWTVRCGLSAVVAGLGVQIAGISETSVIALVAGAAVAGAGFGAAFSGLLKSLGPLAGNHQRAELFAAIYLVCYVSYGLPVVVAGIVSGYVGLVPAATGYAVSALIITAISLITTELVGRKA